ncbi:TetR family transcriptional regulator [uncultured Deinococcus sp.]|uniref:TetR/AcrR family transcriptional regulator n=1 Tax=uncultured Deinococcus sp. TaxID=158789 RepID=UPI002590B45C|nr:TetR family transcriptional regulator [uncultured Deinococcus sp.]
MARSAHPELTRAALLAAARQVLRRQGATLSLDAVAREAGISKGGLLHHYPTKERLLAALAQALVEDFQRELAAVHGAETAQRGPQPGAWLRAYIEVCFRPDVDEPALSAALAPLGALPEQLASLQEMQAFVLRDAEADGLPAGRAHAVRLACDGLWLGRQVGIPDLDAARLAALKEELIAWTRP